jgi:hypothetical protein
MVCEKSSHQGREDGERRSQKENAAQEMKPNQKPTNKAGASRSQQEPAGAAHSQQDAGGAPNLTGKALGEWASRAWRPGVAAVIKPLRLPPPGKLGHLRCDPFTLFRMLTTVTSRYEILDELISDVPG